MLVELLDGSMIENAKILGAGNGSGDLDFLIIGDGVEAEWMGQDMIRAIYFDRDTRTGPIGPVPEMGPDDFKIGTRHDSIATDLRELDTAEGRRAKFADDMRATLKQ